MKLKYYIQTGVVALAPQPSVYPVRIRGMTITV